MVVGALGTNAYVVADDASGECAVIDPGADGGEIAEALGREGLTLRYILATHGHGDHVGGVAELQARLGGEFAAPDGDRGQIEHPSQQLVTMLTGYGDPPSIDLPLTGGETFDLGETRISVVATPGHTPGSLCYLAEGRAFTGDTLFRGSIGRYDLPGGDGDLELRSIREQLLTLPDETEVLPGHGPASTIGAERATNPFLREV